jgi:hypothetical protein
VWVVTKERLKPRAIPEEPDEKPAIKLGAFCVKLLDKQSV